MKNKYIWFLYVILGLVLVLQGCGGVNNPSDNATPTPSPSLTPTPIPSPGKVVHITQNINGDTTWTNDTLYILDKYVYVNAALTIQAGTIIKFNTGFGLEPSGTGKITANGTQYAHITFTSIEDDSIGGDTNGNGTATAPARGDWYRINIKANGSLFNYCDFYYGGDGMYEDSFLFGVSGDYSATITNCAIAHSLKTGMYLSGVSSITLTGNIFYDNRIPLWINPNISISDDSNVFHNPAQPTQGNDYNGIWIRNSYGINVDTNWGETEVPFVLKGDTGVEATKTLTLQPGVIIKLLNSGISISGTLIANGTSAKHITFTSYYDDSKGGDTDNGGAACEKGDWGGILVSEDGTVFNYCDFYYGGAGMYTTDAMMYFNPVAVTITHCNFAHSTRAALNIVGIMLTSVVTDNAFYDSTMPIWMSPDFSIDGSNIFHNPGNASEGNTQNGIWLQESHGISVNTDWGVSEVPYICAVIGIDNGTEPVTLTIAPNAIVKFKAAGRIDIGAYSSIANFDNVTFTSIKDDADGGDTNGDGPSTGANNDWSGIQAFAGGAQWLTTSNILFDSH